MSGGRLLVLILGAPLVEILSIVVTADLIGALPTFLMIVAGGIAGVAVLRLAGRTAFEELRRETREGVTVVDARVIAGASRLVLVGILLIVPGFVSDLIALALSIPAVRALLIGRLRRRDDPQPRPPARPGVVELGEGDYRRIDDRRP